MYLIEGNIGAGKSTFLQLVKDHLPHLEVVFEPVNVWYNAEHGKSLLQNFYTDTKRWAYTMESFTLINRTFENNKIKASLKNTPSENPTGLSDPIAERSIYSGYYCFAKNSHENGFMDRLEWNIYEKWFHFLTGHYSYTPPKGFIYLRTTPSVAYDRILKRSRSAESLISFSYINQIHQRHEDLLLNNNHTELHTGAPVLVLDANVNFEENQVAFQEMLEKLQNFML